MIGLVSLGSIVIDLHLHSTFSDGTDSPERIVDLAVQAGCSAIALTDHDTLDGIEPAQKRAAEVGLRVIPGCELSCYSSDGSMHMLVYFLEPGEGPLQEELERQQSHRRERNKLMVARLREMGLPLRYDEVVAEARGAVVGRPHIAGVLLRKGVVASIPEAFERYLHEGGPAYVERQRLTAAEAIDLAHASGAVTSLAHPLDLAPLGDQLEQSVRNLANEGLDALEAIYGSYSPRERDALAQLADRCNLRVSGGSDYHGLYKPHLNVGSGTGDLCIPDEVLGALQDLLAGSDNYGRHGYTPPHGNSTALSTAQQRRTHRETNGTVQRAGQGRPENT